MKTLASQAVRVCWLFIVVNPAFAQMWTQTTAPMANWVSVASSADGSKLVAAVKGGPIYTSPHAGLTWEPTRAPITDGGNL